MKIIKTADYQENKARSNFRKAPIIDACGNCQYLVKAGLYKCSLHGFNLSVAYICDDYSRDPSGPGVIIPGEGI
jgi:hypothetical protein